MQIPKIKREVFDDPELAKARGNVLLDLLARRKMKKVKAISGRNLSKAQNMALQMLEKGEAYEILIDSTEFGDDKVDPVTQQVRPYEKQQRVIMSQEIYPENKAWIEHIMKALQGVPLKRREVETIKRHIRRLNYEGALRDMYEFYGMTIKELREKEKEYRVQGSIAEADRLKKVLDRVDKKLKKHVRHKSR